MMNKGKIVKFLISLVVMVVFIGLLTLVLYSNIDLKVFKIISFNSLMEISNGIETSNTNLTTQQERYSSALSSVQTAQKEFEKEKQKYESISDATIQIIKEANTTEKYNIEFMWVRLGNYAAKNKLTIILVEPGGSVQAPTSTETNSETSQTTTSSSQTPTGTQTPAPPTGTSNSTGLGVQVTGDYLNISDFIYEVENDKELRFKLDNISMEYVEGNNIKVNFIVKNITVEK
ncbi:MAG: hypothetical protein N2749_00135 [Clostridia bacterium]|nr:hypothetical protein [Clostridia bacterium]